MRFEDEFFVKLFCGDTVTTRTLPWQARGMLWEILRKGVDRAGLLELKGNEVHVAVAAMIDAPVEDVREYLPLLMSGPDPTLVVQGDVLVWPRYIAGQSSQQSSTARSRAQRARNRALARARALGLEPALTDQKDEKRTTQMSLPSTTSTNTVLSSDSSRTGTPRPEVGRTVSIGDDSSQNGTHRGEESRSEELGGRSVVNRERGDPARDAGRPPFSNKTDPVPEDVAQVFAWLESGQRALRGRATPEVDSETSRGMVRHVLERTALPLAAWREAIEGCVLELRDKPPDKHRWLSLDTLSKPANFRRSRQVYLDHRAEQRERDETERIRKAALEADRRAQIEATQREEAEAEAALSVLELKPGVA